MDSKKQEDQQKSLEELREKLSRERQRGRANENVRRAVAMTARGSTSLQTGRYVTRDNLEEIRRQNLEYEFKKSK